MPCPSLSFSFTLLSHSCLLFFLPCLHTCCLFPCLSSSPSPLLLHHSNAYSQPLATALVFFILLIFSPAAVAFLYTLFLLNPLHSFLSLRLCSFCSTSLFPSSHFPPGSGVSTCLFVPPPLHVPSLPPPPHKLSILSLVQQQDV